MQVEDAGQLKMRNLPTSLYKYASFSARASNEEAETLGKNVAGQPWTLINLRDQVVALRPPSTFNDPYDSCLSFNETALLNDQIIKRAQKLRAGGSHADLLDAHDQVPLPPPENALEEQYQAAWKKDPVEFGPYAQFKQIMDKVIQGINYDTTKQFNKGIGAALRVGCFSESNDSIVMWSHYADNHKGLCIEYETRLLSLPNAIGLLHPVNYHPEHFDATEYFRSDDYNNWMLWIAACHKSPEWSYEREWRYIDTSMKDRIRIKPKMIILSANIDAERMVEVTAIANNLQIPLSQALCEPNKFKMIFRRL
jgi:hypothetical protein